MKIKELSQRRYEALAGYTRPAVLGAYVLDYHSRHEWAPNVAERTGSWSREWYAKADALSEG